MNRNPRHPRLRNPTAVLAMVAALLLTGGAGSVASGAPGQTAATTVAAPEIMPVSEVRAGMIGVGHTVVRGTEPETFDVEILGVLPDPFPKTDLIIARLGGLGLERSNVLSGMSGSPVFIDGRVIGAVAYRLVNFGHEAIAGIMPIEAMLRVAMLEEGRPAQRQGLTVAGRPGQAAKILEAAAAYLTGAEPAEVPSLGPVVGGGAGIEPIATPVSFGGIRPDVVRRITPLFESLGWTPSLGGTTGGSRSVPANLAPGGVVGAQLMRGDINVTATGTVSYRDGDVLLAFGHPFLQGGNVDFPMVAAEVITVLSSMSASSKLTAAGDEILGSIRQDRLAAIMGVIGAEPELIPVRLSIGDGKVLDETLSFELVSDKLLTPLYLFLGLVNGIQSIDQVYGESTLEVMADFHLGQGLEPVSFTDLFSSQDQAVITLSSNLAAIFSFLYDNRFEAIDIEEIDLAVNLRSDRNVAEISRVWTDRLEVEPGETVQVMVALQPYRGPGVIERLSFQVPEAVGSGPLTVVVGDAASISREEQSFVEGQFEPRNLRHLVRLLNNIRSSDRIYLQASRPEPGAFVNGEILPSLPASRLQVLASEQSSGDFVHVSRAVISEQAQPVDYVVSGSHKIELHVRPR